MSKKKNKKNMPERIKRPPHRPDEAKAEAKKEAEADAEAVEETSLETASEPSPNTVKKTKPEVAIFTRSRLYMALSFFLPFTIMGIAFALHGIFPFGDQQILSGFDPMHQYYPFLSEFWHRMRSGSSLLWSWTGGGGIDYWGLYAYYLASPLNFLVVIFPHEWLREVMALITLIKVGLAGLFMAVYLRGTFRRCDISLPVFAVFYGLCAFTLGHYIHIMWFDTVALLPLVILGVQSLVKEGKYRLFVVSLALSVYLNYYFGIYTCIFVAIMFFCNVFIHKLDFKQFLKKLGMITVYSGIALGMVAILLLPAISNMLATTNLDRHDFPSGISFFNPFSDVLGNLMVFSPPEKLVLNDLPNIYSGVLMIVLTAVFICSPKIKPREKIGYLTVVAFLILSFNIEVLNYIWNGFYIPVGIRNRYSFLLSFMIIVMAYRAFTVIEQTEKQKPNNLRKIFIYTLFIGAAATLGFIIADFSPVGGIFVTCIAMLCGYFLGGYFISTKNLTEKHDIKQILLNVLFIGATAMLILLMASNGPQDNRLVIFGAVLCVVYLAAYFIFLRGTPKFRRAAILIAVAAVLTEIFTSCYIGVSTVDLTDRNGYPDRYEEVQQLLSLTEVSEFNRAEFYGNFTDNDPHLYNYQGVSFYSSSASVAQSEFYSSLGIFVRDAGKRCVYNAPSPLIDAFLNIRYLVARDGKLVDHGLFWESVTEANGVTLLENNFLLPLGFMVDDDLAEYSVGITELLGKNPFLNQNDLFRRATGLDGDLFTLIDFAREDHAGYETGRRIRYEGGFEYTHFFKTDEDTPGHLKWDYVIHEDGFYFAFPVITAVTPVSRVFLNGQTDRIMNPHRTAAFPVGFLSERDVLSFFYAISSQTGGANILLARLDEDLFIEGYSLLASEPMAITEFSDTQVFGKVTTANGGLLYTSIPYEGGRWRAFVDGSETEIIPVAGAMSALHLAPGSYNIEFRYSNPTFTAGVIVSILSITVFAAIILKDIHGLTLKDIRRELARIR